MVVGVFDGLHLGHAYLLEHLVAEAARRRRRPVVITFDHHPDEIITGSAPPLLCDPDERLERLAAAGVDTTVVVHFDQRLRETTYDAFVAMIADRAPACRVPHDARRRVRLPARRDAGDARGARARSRGSRWSSCRRSSSTGARSAARRSALPSRRGPGARRAPPRTRALRRGQAVDRAAGPGSLLRFPLPVALPPDGTYAVEVGPVHAGASDEAVIDARIRAPASGRRRRPGSASRSRRAPDRDGVSRRRLAGMSMCYGLTNLAGIIASAVPCGRRATTGGTGVSEAFFTEVTSPIRFGGPDSTDPLDVQGLPA